MQKFFLIGLIFLCTIGSVYSQTTLYPDYVLPDGAQEENYPIDQRAYARFKNSELKQKISAQIKQGEKVELSDFSRGGVALNSKNLLKQGEVYPLKITYNEIVIPLDIEVLENNSGKIRTKFVNLDIPKQNKLLYLSAKIELDNNLLKTKLSVY